MTVMFSGPDDLQNRPDIQMLPAAPEQFRLRLWSSQKELTGFQVPWPKMGFGSKGKPKLPHTPQ